VSFYQYYYYLLWFYFVFSFKTTSMVNNYQHYDNECLTPMVKVTPMVNHYLLPRIWCLKIQWWKLPVFDLISKNITIETVLKTWVKGISSKIYNPTKWRQGLSSPQLLERINLAIEQKSLPLYDVGASFRLTRIFTPRSNIKMAFKINNPDLDSFKKWTNTKN
jgi:hypothetical protein